MSKRARRSETTTEKARCGQGEQGERRLSHGAVLEQKLARTREKVKLAREDCRRMAPEVSLAALGGLDFKPRDELSAEKSRNEQDHAMKRQVLRNSKLSLFHAFVVGKLLLEALQCPPWARGDAEVQIIELFIRSFVIFKKLDELPRKRVSRALVMRVLKAGDAAFHQGESNASGFFMILSGSMEVFKGVGLAKHRVSTLGAGDGFGMAGMLNPKGHRDSTVEATCQTQLLQFSQETLHLLVTTEKRCKISTLLDIPLAMLPRLDQPDQVEGEGGEEAKRASTETTKLERLEKILQSNGSARTSQALDVIGRLIAHLPFAQKLPPVELADVCREMSFLQVPAGTVMVEDDLDGMCVLLKGQLCRKIRPDKDAIEAAVGTDFDGDPDFLEHASGIATPLSHSNREEDEFLSRVALEETTSRGGKDSQALLDAPEGELNQVLQQLSQWEDAEEAVDRGALSSMNRSRFRSARFAKLTGSTGSKKNMFARPRRRANPAASMRVRKAPVQMPIRKTLQTGSDVVEQETLKEHVARPDAQSVADEEGDLPYQVRYRRSLVGAIEARLSDDWNAGKAAHEIKTAVLHPGSCIGERRLMTRAEKQCHICQSGDFEEVGAASCGQCMGEKFSETCRVSFVAMEECKFLILSQEAYERALVCDARRSARIINGKLPPSLDLRVLMRSFPHERPAKELEELQDAWSSLPFFAQLPRATRSELCRFARIEKFAQDEVIVCQGDKGGHKFFVVLCGSVSVMIQDREVNRLTEIREGFGRCVRILGPGMAFGEFAMLKSDGRSASVLARQNACLLAIDYADYARVFNLNIDQKMRLRNYMEMSPETRNVIEMSPPFARSGQQLKRVMQWAAEQQFFKSFNKGSLETLCQDIRLCQASDGEVIFKEGDPAEDVLLVLSGGISAHRTSVQQDSLGTAAADVPAFLQGFGPCVESVHAGGTMSAMLQPLSARSTRNAQNRWNRSATALARGPTKYCLIGKATLDRVVSEEHSVVCPDLVRDLVVKPVSQRSVFEQAQLEQLLLRINFVKQLGHDAQLIHRLSKLVQFEALAAGSPVFLQGDPGDKLYIVLEGTVQVRKKSHQEDVKVLHVFGKNAQVGSLAFETALKHNYGELIVEMSTGDSFGEMALESDIERSGSAVCLEPCKFLTLSRDNYRDTLLEIGEGLVFQPTLSRPQQREERVSKADSDDLRQKIQTMRAMIEHFSTFKEIVQSCGSKLLDAICERLEYKPVGAGHVFGLRGDTGKKVVVLVKGEAELFLPRDDTGENSTGTGIAAMRRRLGPGDLILESAVALGVPLQFSVRAVDRCVTVVLSEFWYLRLWPEAHRMQGKLRSLQQTSIFARSHPRELAAAVDLMASATYHRGSRIKSSHDLVLIQSGTCEVRAHNRSIAELSPGELYGEGNCSQEKTLLASLEHEVLIARSNVRVFRVPLTQLLPILTSDTMKKLSAQAYAKFRWRKNLASRQRGSPRNRNDAFDASQTRLRSELKSSLQKPHQSQHNPRPSSSPLSSSSLSSGALLGNIFQGSTWMDAHLTTAKRGVPGPLPPRRPPATPRSPRAFSALGKRNVR